MDLKERKLKIFLFAALFVLSSALYSKKLFKTKNIFPGARLVTDSIYPSKIENLKYQSKSKFKNKKTNSKGQILSKACFVMEKESSLFNGEVKIWVHELSDETILMIKAQDCPHPLFSYIVLDSTGKIIKLIDCHYTTKEELVLNAGIQGDIHESKPNSNSMDLAVSGPGFFLEKCKEKFYLTRRGNFFVSKDNTLVTNNGCLVVDQNGRAFKVPDEQINYDGCSTSQCLAIIQPREGEFHFISRNRLSFTGSIEESRVDEPYIFINHEEDIDKDGGIIGPSFDERALFDKKVCL